MPCIHSAVAAALARRPERVLLVDERRYLDNAALLAAIDRRARLLREHCAPDATAAVRLQPGVELVVSYFACLAAGVRYLPLPADPAAVTAALLDALAPAVLVTDRAADVAAGHGVAVLDVTRLPPVTGRGMLPPPDPARIAHVLLTSGSETGRPKAVLTDHRGSLRAHAWRAALWPYAGDDVVGCNIFGIWDVVPALLHDVPVVLLADRTVRDPLELAAAIVRFGITRLMLTPTLLDACLTSAAGSAGLARLRRIVLCGESVSAPQIERAQRALPGVALANLYSISECHDVGAAELGHHEPEALRIADFAEVHVCDPDDRERPLPAGRPGRILVGGSALAQGYLDPGDTRRRFFDTTLGGRLPMRRLYDTGDLGRLNADGRLEVLGRVDRAVKIRGRWADPDVVATLLGSRADVARAAAAADRDPRGQMRLHAFVVPEGDPGPDLAVRLRRFLVAQLPAQLVPARIHVGATLPLTASGKVDARQLAAPARSAPAPDPADEDALLRVVVDAFRQALGRTDVDPAARFDDLGGDSLAAIAVCARLQDVTGTPVRVRDLLEQATATALAHRLATGAGAADEPLALPALHIRPRRRTTAAAPATVFLTGATGALGVAVLRRLLTATSIRVIALVRGTDDDQARARLGERLPAGLPPQRLDAIRGDLARPRLGIGNDRYAALAERLDAVLHLGAGLDMFASARSLAPVNVEGTRAALELAAASGAVFHHVSSSAVLPLDGATWDESHYGSAFTRRIAARLAGSDGYSQSKLAAEHLVWQAAEQGLAVTVTRVPHLVGPGSPRLTETLHALLELGVLPDAPWAWHAVPLDVAGEAIVDGLRHGAARPLRHLSAAPLTDARIAAAAAPDGAGPTRLPLPALACAIASGADSPRIAALDQLARQYGIGAAVCVGEPRLLSPQPLDADRPDLTRRTLDWLLGLRSD